MNPVSFLSEPRWEACTLVSGSSGNATFVSAGRTKLLIDAGVAAKHLEAALRAIGEDPRNLSGILITHEHHDHIRGAGPLARRYQIPLYANEKTVAAMLPGIGNAAKTRIERFNSSEAFTLDDFEIMPFRTSHDATEPVGFRLNSERYSVSLCTDSGELGEEIFDVIEGSDLIFLESNYDDRMLISGPYPWSLKQRIRSRYGHLSNELCGAAACRLVEAGTEKIVLSHLSKENNIPALAELTVMQILQEGGVVPGDDFILSVAPRHKPGRLHRFAETVSAGKRAEE